MSLKLLKRTTGRGYGTAVSGLLRLNTPASIDAKVAVATTIFTVPAGSTMVITGVRLRCTAAVAITVAAEAGVGIAAGFDDIWASQPLYGLTASGKVFEFPLGGSGVIATAGDEVKLGIDVAATGTSQTVEADVMGYEV